MVSGGMEGSVGLAGVGLPLPAGDAAAGEGGRQFGRGFGGSLL